MEQNREHTHRDNREHDARGDAHIGQGHLVLHDEQVEVHTERVATGRVTLRKQVVTEEVTVPVTLRHERLEVIEEAFDDAQATGGVGDGQDSTTADRSAAMGTRADGGRDDSDRSGRADGIRADVRRLDDGDVEITLYAERPVVSVEVVPVERVRVRRGVVTETETLRVDVAREEAYLDEEKVDEHVRRGGHDR